MAQPTLTIIIINYNTPKLVYNCLESIKQYVSIPFEVVLIENGSKHESRISNHELGKILANYKLIISEKNLGFGGGNNLGAKNANGKYLWFLNSDTLLSNDAARQIIEFMERHPETGAVSPLLYHDNGEMQGSFFANFQTLGSITFRRYNYKKVDLSQEFFYTDIVVGAAMMIERKKFEEVGGFDLNIFMYLEDDDICKRLENTGYKNAVLNTADIIHLEGRSTKNFREKKKLYYKSQTYFWYKHNGKLPTLIMRLLRWPWKVINTRGL